VQAAEGLSSLIKMRDLAFLTIAVVFGIIVGVVLFVIADPSRQPVEHRGRLVERERAPDHPLRDFLRELCVERICLDKRAAAPVGVTVTSKNRTRTRSG